MPSKGTDVIVSRLFGRDQLPPLEPGKTVWDPSLTREIKASGEHKYVIASLHLANDDIESCHIIAQEVEEPTANLLHAILHRREGDYWNSKYWWSRVRSHPTLKSASDAKAFVDACEKAAGSGSSEETKLRQRQWDEIKGLVTWTRENCH